MIDQSEKELLRKDTGYQRRRFFSKSNQIMVKSKNELRDLHIIYENSQYLIKKVENIQNGTFFTQIIPTDINNFDISSMQHENILNIKQEDNIFLAEPMECTLQQFLTLPDIDIDQYQIIRQLVNFIHFLHQQNLAHTELNTQNFLINDRQELKAVPLPQEGIQYRAPERIIGQESENMKSEDMFQLGCIILEILCKKPLLESEDETNQMLKYSFFLGRPQEIIYRNIFHKLPDTNPVDLDQYFINADEKLVKILKQLLLYDPEKRASIEEVQNYLDQVYPNRPTRFNQNNSSPISQKSYQSLHSNKFKHQRKQKQESNNGLSGSYKHSQNDEHVINLYMDNSSDILSTPRSRAYKIQKDNSLKRNMDNKYISNENIYGLREQIHNTMSDQNSIDNNSELKQYNHLYQPSKSSLSQRSEKRQRLNSALKQSTPPHSRTSSQYLINQNDPNSEKKQIIDNENGEINQVLRKPYDLTEQQQKQIHKYPLQQKGQINKNSPSSNREESFFLGIEDKEKNIQEHEISYLQLKRIFEQENQNKKNEVELMNDDKERIKNDEKQKIMKEMELKKKLEAEQRLKEQDLLKKLEEEQRKKDEEIKKREQEQMKKDEELRKKDEENKYLQEQLKKQEEEIKRQESQEKKLKEELAQKQNLQKQQEQEKLLKAQKEAEEKLRKQLESEQQKVKSLQEEIIQKKKEEEDAKKKREEEQKKKEEEQKKKEIEQKKKEEEQKKKEDEQKQKEDEQRKKEEEQKKKEENQKKIEDEQKKKEEEQKKLEMELKKAQEQEQKLLKEKLDKIAEQEKKQNELAQQLEKQQKEAQEAIKNEQQRLMDEAKKKEEQLLQELKIKELELEKKKNEDEQQRKKKQQEIEEYKQKELDEIKKKELLLQQKEQELERIKREEEEKQKQFQDQKKKEEEIQMEKEKELRQLKEIELAKLKELEELKKKNEQEQQKKLKEEERRLQEIEKQKQKELQDLQKQKELEMKKLKELERKDQELARKREDEIKRQQENESKKQFQIQEENHEREKNKQLLDKDAQSLKLPNENSPQFSENRSQSGSKLIILPEALQRQQMISNILQQEIQFNEIYRQRQGYSLLKFKPQQQYKNSQNSKQNQILPPTMYDSKQNFYPHNEQNRQPQASLNLRTPRINTDHSIIKSELINTHERNSNMNSQQNQNNQSLTNDTSNSNNLNSKNPKIQLNGNPIVMGEQTNSSDLAQNNSINYQPIYKEQQSKAVQTQSFMPPIKNNSTSLPPADNRRNSPNKAKYQQTLRKKGSNNLNKSVDMKKINRKKLLDRNQQKNDDYKMPPLSARNETNQSQDERTKFRQSHDGQILSQSNTDSVPKIIHAKQNNNIYFQTKPDQPTIFNSRILLQPQNYKILEDEEDD